MKQKKSILVGWAFSYLIILMIPIITIFIYYAYSTKVIRSEIYEANEMILDNLKDNTDRYLDEQRSFYAYILTNDNFDFLASNPDKDAQFYYDVAKLTEQMANYNYYGTEMSALIYFSEKDYVIYKRGANDSRFVYNSMQLNYPVTMDYEEWVAMLGGEYGGQFLTERYLCYREKSEECVVYAKSVTYLGEEKINIFISIPISLLEELTKPLASGTNLIIGIDGEAILALSNEGMQEVTDDMRRICRTYGEDFFETADYMGVREASNQKGISYCLLIPKEEFWKELRYMRNVLSISLIVTLFVRFCCVTLLLKRNFRPVSDLVSKTVGNSGKGNEYKLIENAYSKLVGENNTMYKRIIAQKEIARSNYLLSMMKGRTMEKDESIISLLPGQKIVLAGFSVPLLDEKQIQHDELMLFAVDNIFSELMEKSTFYRIEDGRYLFYLFVVSDNTEEWRKQCLGEANYLCDIMREKWKSLLLAAVSGIEDDLDNLRFLYQDIMEGFEDRKLLGGAGVVDTELKYHSEARNKGIVQSITEYAEEHYSDSSLNITAIAESMGRNPKYISRVFKEETGEGILDYVNRMRISKAQAMLRTRQYSLEQVSEMSGYASVKTFRRAFAKITGTTPGKYMDDWEQSEDKR